MEPHNPSDKKTTDEIIKTQEIHIPESLSPISLYKKDKDFIFFHQKTEKLVSAVYMLTNFLPTEETMKWSLRTLGARLLKSTIDLKEGTSLHKIQTEQVVRDTVLEVSSLLEVAQFAGLVSEMNVAILQREFHGLLAFIHDTIHATDGREIVFVQDQVRPQKTSFESLVPQHSTPGDPALLSHTSIGNRDNNTLENTVSIKDKNEFIHPKQKALKEFSPVAVKKNKRQSIIINLLKRKKEIMVKDVSQVITDCSEKTLQRELLALVSQGVLVKEGERRWTTYSLAS